MKTLVLDKTYQPVKVISWQEAFRLYFRDKVEIVSEYAGKVIRSATAEWIVPAVVRLKNYFQKYNIIPKLSRSNLFIRDKGFCQYCKLDLQKSKFTIDHVVPRAQGGRTSWTNVVISCRDCNQKKGNRTPAEAKMKLINKPTIPTNLPKKELKFVGPNEWEEYLWAT